MILHTDIPDRAQVSRLLAHRAPWSVSIYLETDPASTGDAERIGFKNLTGEAIAQLRDGGAPTGDVSLIEDETADLIDDDSFWRYQARTLAVFVTPQSLLTFRLPNRLQSSLEVADRFAVKPCSGP